MTPITEDDLTKSVEEQLARTLNPLLAYSKQFETLEAIEVSGMQAKPLKLYKHVWKLLENQDHDNLDKVR